MEDVRRYYDEQVEREWERLERHRTEYAVTFRALADYLPSPPSAVLDVGGGPGRYSVELAARGYRVTLLDLSPRSVEFACEKARERGVHLDAAQGTATDLSRFADGSFGAVLLMGPLYHLIDGADRQRAVREAWRVLAPGGVVFVSYITRYARLRDAANRRAGEILAARQRWERTLETGIALPSFGDGFTAAYLARPTEVCSQLEAAGFETLDLIAAEGLTDGIAEGIEALPGEAWDAWVDLNYRLGRDPSVHGAASHLVYVGRSRG